MKKRDMDLSMWQNLIHQVCMSMYNQLLVEGKSVEEAVSSVTNLVEMELSSFDKDTVLILSKRNTIRWLKVMAKVSKDPEEVQSIMAAIDTIDTLGK